MSDKAPNFECAIVELYWPPLQHMDVHPGVSAGSRINLAEYIRDDPKNGNQSDDWGFIFSEKEYADCDRPTQEKLVSHIQASCAEQGFSMTVHTWANAEQRGTLRIRLKCSHNRRTKCKFSFQLCYGMTECFWYLRRGSGKHIHTGHLIEKPGAGAEFNPSQGNKESKRSASPPPPELRRTPPLTGMRGAKRSVSPISQKTGEQSRKQQKRDPFGEPNFGLEESDGPRPALGQDQSYPSQDGFRMPFSGTCRPTGQQQPLGYRAPTHDEREAALSMIAGARPVSGQQMERTPSSNDRRKKFIASHQSGLSGMETGGDTQRMGTFYHHKEAGLRSPRSPRDHPDKSPIPAHRSTATGPQDEEALPMPDFSRETTSQFSNVSRTPAGPSRDEVLPMPDFSRDTQFSNVSRSVLYGGSLHGLPRLSDDPPEQRARKSDFSAYSMASSRSLQDAMGELPNILTSTSSLPGQPRAIEEGTDRETAGVAGSKKEIPEFPSREIPQPKKEIPEFPSRPKNTGSFTSSYSLQEAIGDLPNILDSTSSLPEAHSKPETQDKNVRIPEYAALSQKEGGSFSSTSNYSSKMPEPRNGHGFAVLGEHGSRPGLPRADDKLSMGRPPPRVVNRRNGSGGMLIDHTSARAPLSRGSGVLADHTSAPQHMGGMRPKDRMYSSIDTFQISTDSIGMEDSAEDINELEGFGGGTPAKGAPKMEPPSKQQSESSDGLGETAAV